LKPEQKVARDLAARIRHFRHEREMSQELLAEAAGIHRTYLGGIETGRRNPSLKNLWRISKALGIPLSRLFEGVG
jgi:transcriptional regulator with XRE-family HTH domain